MIGRIFLGKAWHWALFAVACVLFWYCGTQRLHVIEFNLFITAMIVGTAAVITAVLWAHRPGEQITREMLVASDSDTGSVGDLAS
ncbi:MAG: hypothetical protein AAFY64_01090 [Pseudomonadota bacterium]